MADETPWLDQDELNNWLSLFSVLTRLPGSLDNQLQRDAGLWKTASQVHQQAFIL